MSQFIKNKQTNNTQIFSRYNRNYTKYQTNLQINYTTNNNNNKNKNKQITLFNV